MHPTSTQAHFLTLRAQGLSYDKIAKDLHVSKHTLLSWAEEFPPKIDTQLRAAYEKYQTALITRVEFLAQQFQTVTKLITTCDPKSSAYPRYFNILLKLHNALQKFDLDPEPQSTETAPEMNHPETLNENTGSTKTAPPLNFELPKHEPQSTKSAPSYPPLSPRLAGLLNPEDTKTAPELPLELVSSLPIRREASHRENLKSSAQPPVGEIQNLLPPPEQELQKLHKILERLDRAEAKLAS